MQNKDTLIIQ